MLMDIFNVIVNKLFQVSFNIIFMENRKNCQNIKYFKLKFF